MLTELIEAIDDCEGETQTVIKSELKKVFGKHIEEIIDDLLKGNLENVKKALDMPEEHEEEELEPIKRILSTITECQRKKKEEIKPTDFSGVAVSILKVYFMKDQ